MLTRLVPTKTSRGDRRAPHCPRSLPSRLGLALVVLGAYSAVRPAAGQETFPEPSEIVSENGVLQVKLTAEQAQIELAGTPVAARVYNGAFVGPTLRLNPGDKLELELDNTLSRADEPPLPRHARFAIRGFRQCLAPRHGRGDRAVSGWISRPTMPQAPTGTTRTSTGSRRSRSSAACPG